MTFIVPRFSILLLVFALFLSSASQADICFFQCKRIPKANEILKTYGPLSTSSLDKKTIHVVSWNIYKAYKPDFPIAFQKVSTGADIILISEAVDSQRALSSLLEKKDFQWNMAISWFMKHKVATGLMIGSSAAPVSLSYAQTHDREIFANTPKMILASTYYHSPTQQNIMVLNLHGINFVNLGAYKRQMIQLDQLLSFHKGPVILAGDFNSWREDRQQLVQQVMDKHKLHQVEWSNTASGYKVQVDLAFVRDLQVLQARVINEVVDVASDHPALSFEVIPNLH